MPLTDSILEVPDNEYDDGRNEDLSLLYKFIGTLDNLSKAIIILHLDGNSYKEIAEILGLSESNIGTKISRIKKILKHKFDEHARL